jgi:hypothetical protein
LVVLLGTSILAVVYGGPAWTSGLLSGQVIFYLAALAGRRLGPLGRVARTFVVLNVAAVVGLWRYLVGAQKVTW